MTEEHKRKIGISNSVALKGKTPWNKGLKGCQVAWNKDKKITGKHVKHLRESFKKRPPITEKTKEKIREANSGEKSYLWKGGGMYWNKQKAKIRDDYTCQVCGLRDVEIVEVDHIKPKSVYPELVASLENLMTMCPNCHRRKTIKDRKIIKETKTITAD